LLAAEPLLDCVSRRSTAVRRASIPSRSPDAADGMPSLLGLEIPELPLYLFQALIKLLLGWGSEGRKARFEIREGRGAPRGRPF
jgi:hypothetical protein